jgi:hypothetical protein
MKIVIYDWTGWLLLAVIFLVILYFILYKIFAPTPNFIDRDEYQENLEDLKKAIEQNKKMIMYLTKDKEILVQIPYRTDNSNSFKCVFGIGPDEKKYHFEELKSGIQFTIKENYSTKELELETPMTRLDLVDKAKKMIRKQNGVDNHGQTKSTTKSSKSVVEDNK